uniref:Uncharacterized protein n=1 Tax=Opuntia streptacantha TaxID=393608 RepID=A0A7C9CB08_OPUST
MVNHLSPLASNHSSVISHHPPPVPWPPPPSPDVGHHSASTKPRNLSPTALAPPNLLLLYMILSLLRFTSSFLSPYRLTTTTFLPIAPPQDIFSSLCEVLVSWGNAIATKSTKFQQKNPPIIEIVGSIGEEKEQMEGRLV